MNDWDFRLEFDIPEPRVNKDRLVFSADGTTWDPLSSSDVYVDPVTRTAFLMPLPYTSGWQTTSTGSYTRLRKTDYTLITSANWIENPRLNSGDYYLESLGTSEIVTTSASYSVNKPFYISCHVHSDRNLPEVPYLSCGWGSPSTGVSLTFYASGDVKVFKGGAQVGVYSLSGAGELAGGNRPGGTSQIGDETVSFLLLPCRGVELLVLSSQGSGFNHAFSDLTLSPTMATVTPVGTFWWQVPSPFKASVSAAPLKFKTSGVLRSPSIGVRYPPEFGAAFDTRLAFHTPGFGTSGGTVTLVDASTDAGFLANGVNDDPVRIKVAMTGDGDATPYIYSADFVKLRTLTTTYDNPFDATEYLRSLSLSVPEKGMATIGFSLLSRVVTDAGLDRPTRISDRPVRLSLVKTVGETETLREVFRGTAARPEVRYGIRDSIREAAFQASDREAMFALYSFRDTLPYDGFTLSNAILELVALAGFDTADLDISADTFALPASLSQSLGQWNLLPDRGDTVASWIDRIHSTFAGTWITGWAPTTTGYKYRFREPGSFSDTPVVTLYTKHESAKTAGVTADKLIYRTVREKGLKRTGIEPEANQIIVIGQNPQTGRYITSQYDDADSQDPTLAPADRPLNWRGCVVSYQLSDPLITTHAAADRARDILVDRLTTSRTIWTVTGDFLLRDDDGFEGLPVWKGDVLRVMAPDDEATEYVDMRVLSFDVESVQESAKAGKTNIRNATYRCEQIAEVLA